MSSQIRKVKITPRAKADLLEIGRYTLATWGIAQRNKYLRGLDDAFNSLAANPLLGRQRQDISEGYYSFPVGSHVLFYLIFEAHIAVIGIPHKSSDIIHHF